MVSIAVSKMGMTELIFVIPRMKVNRQYYGDAVLSQQMLPASSMLQAICLSFSKTPHHIIVQGHH